MASFAARYSALTLALCSSIALADPLDQALSESAAHSQAAQSSQRKIENLDDSTQQMLDGYRSAIIQARNLERYNAQMRELVATQRKELDGYQQQLADLEQTEASVAPQMQRMLDVLQEFVAADIPFLPHERNERVENLQELMQRADIGLSEKYRRLLEAYQIESDYGYTLEAWCDSLQRDDKMLSVDFLRIGRVMLYYQTPDGHETGWWNPQARQWQVLEGSARRPVTQAIAVARQQKSADWLELPVKTLALEAKQ